MANNFMAHFTLQDVAADLGPCGQFGMVCPKGQSEYVASSVAAEVTLVSGNRHPATPVPLLGEWL